jgi:hypothetical protein
MSRRLVGSAAVENLFKKLEGCGDSVWLPTSREFATRVQSGLAEY